MKSTIRSNGTSIFEKRKGSFALKICLINILEIVDTSMLKFPGPESYVNIEEF